MNLRSNAVQVCDIPQESHYALLGTRRLASTRPGGSECRFALPTNPFHQHYQRLAATQGTNPAKVSVARKPLICAWHMLARDQAFNPSRSTNAAASSRCFQAA
jgi:hypothetical protein